MSEQRRDYALDPVTFEVLKNAFVTTVDQMAEQILRTCHSFVIYARDFSSALCDANGDTIMQGSQDIAVHVGTLHFTAKAVIEAFAGRHARRATSTRSTIRTWAARTSTTCGSSGRSSTTASDRLRAVERALGRRRRQRARLVRRQRAKEHFGEGLRIPPVRHLGRRPLPRRRRPDDRLQHARRRATTRATSTPRPRRPRVAEREILRLVEKYGAGHRRDRVRRGAGLRRAARPGSASPSCPTAPGRPRTTSTTTRRAARG